MLKGRIVKNRVEITLKIENIDRNMAENGMTGHVCHIYGLLGLIPVELAAAITEQAAEGCVENASQKLLNLWTSKLQDHLTSCENLRTRASKHDENSKGTHWHAHLMSWNQEMPKKEQG